MRLAIATILVSGCSMLFTEVPGAEEPGADAGAGADTKATGPDAAPVECDVYAQGVTCDNARGACYYAGNGATGECHDYGNIDPGSYCTEQWDCPPGYLCHPDGDCKALCLTENNCPTGMDCTQHSDPEISYCY